MRRSLGVRIACLAWLGVLAPLTGALSQEKPVMVFAAASLKTALDEVNRSFGRETGKSATIVYAASNVLAKQIEAGAPADVFVSADLDWMDYAQSRDLIRPDSRVNLLGNTLVLIAPKNSDITIAQHTRLDLSRRLGVERLAMGNVEAVPAGKYGKAALQTSGRMGGRERQDCPGRERAGCTRARVARGGDARHRLPQRRRVRCRCENRLHVSC